MRKKSAPFILILLCFLLIGCKKEFFDYPKMYSSYLDKSLGKWEITSIKDTSEESVEHVVNKRTWLITGENGIKLELSDSIAVYSKDITKEQADILFAREILQNMNNIYGDDLNSDIKNIDKDILDANLFYSNELQDDKKYMDKNDNSLAKKVLDKFIIKDMTPIKFYGNWGNKIEVSIEIDDKNFDRNESIRKEICTFLKQKYNINNIKVIAYANDSRENHASSYIEDEYKLLY